MKTCVYSARALNFIGDSSKPRSWSKYAQDSSEHVINNTDFSNKTGNINLNKTAIKDKNEVDKKSKKKKGLKHEVKEALEKV